MGIKEKLKKPWWWYLLLVSVILILFSGGALAYKALFLTHNIVSQKLTLSGNKNSLGVTKLKGEEEGRVNVLFLGIGVEGQQGADLTDTIMLASLDLRQNNVALISIPRDLYIKVPDLGYSKINAVYTWGNKEEYPGGGGQLMMETVSKILGVPLNYYVVVDFDAFKEIVNTLGGIDIKVEKDIYDYEYPSPNERGYSPFILKKGDYHMDGDLALKYVRSRKSTSDFDRARRQQQVILAIRDKALSLKILANPKKVYELYNTLEKHIKTNFQLPEIARAIELAQNFKLENVNNVVLDDSTQGLLYADNVNGAYVLRPYSEDFSEIQKFVEFCLYEGPQVKKENATIELENGTGWFNLAQDVAKRLKQYNLNIVATTTADRYDYTKSIIYDQSEGQKPTTVSFLAEYFGASVVKKKKESPSDPDIIVIIGQSFLNLYNQQKSY